MKTLRRGFAWPRCPSHEHRAPVWLLAHQRLAQRAALRVLASEVPVLLIDASRRRADDREHPRHLGRARRRRGAPASMAGWSLPSTRSASRAASSKSDFRMRSIDACLALAGLARAQRRRGRGLDVRPREDAGARVGPAARSGTTRVRRRKVEPGAAGRRSRGRVK